MHRRNFMKCMVGGSVLSLAALSEANADIYRSIAELNQDYLQDQAPDGAYWDALSKHFLFEDNLIMMNNGTMGPLPAPVFNTLMKYYKYQATNPFECYNYYSSGKGAIRNNLAGFIGADPDEVAINRNTTEGMNLIASGLDLKKGDEVLLSSYEHAAGTHPWKMKEKRFGIKITEVPFGAPPKDVAEIVNAFEQAITKRTKVISISHTVYITGLISPLKELSELAHKHDIFIVVDSAHGVGMLDLNMKELGVDAFTSSPYKWLGAPMGCGVLYVRKEVQDQVWPSIASSGWDRAGASKFETLGQRADPLFYALGEAMEFQKKIGKSRIARRISTLAAYLKRGLASIDKVRVHTNSDPYLSAGLTAFSIEGVERQAIVNYLLEKYNLVIRTIGSTSDNTAGVRVSTHIFVSFKDIDVLLEGVSRLARNGA